MSDKVRTSRGPWGKTSRPAHLTKWLAQTGMMFAYTAKVSGRISRGESSWWQVDPRRIAFGHIWATKFYERYHDEESMAVVFLWIFPNGHVSIFACFCFANLCAMMGIFTHENCTHRMQLAALYQFCRWLGQLEEIEEETNNHWQMKRRS